MFDIRVQSLLATLWDSFADECRAEPVQRHDNGEKIEKGLLVTVRVNLFAYEEAYHASLYSRLFTVFTGNTSVFFAEDERTKGTWQSLAMARWENSINHDACWRSEGLDHFTAVYFRMAEQINSERELMNLPKIAPKDMSQCNILGGVFSSLHKPWEFVSVHTVPIKAEYGNKRQIVSLKPWDSPKLLVS